MTTTDMSEGPRAATPRPSKPIAPLQNEKDSTIMTHNTDGLMTWRSLATILRPEQIERLDAEERELFTYFPHEENRRLLILWAAEMLADNLAHPSKGDAPGRLRSAIADLDPAELTAADAVALLDVIQAATQTDSIFGKAFREREAARIAAEARP